MQLHDTMLDWRRSLAVAIVAALAVLGLCYLLVPRASVAAPPSQVGTLSLEISKRLQGSDVIQVGQELTFTIRIVNTGTISVTTLPLIDEYESSILQLERTLPPFSTSVVTPATAGGLITWSDLTTSTLFGPLNPGQAIEITTVFRAIAPRVATVNRARIGAAVGFGGQQYAGDGRSSTGDAIGGRVIVEKGLPPDTIAASGLPLTFTITISNDGAADLTRVPLQDTFDPTFLQFASAAPPPGATSDPAAGRLVWDDVLPALGLSRLRPGQIISVTTVFTALRSVDAATINRAESTGVRDEFGDEVQAPRQAEVPIRIIPGPAEATPTATPFPDEQPRPRRTSAPETPTLTPTATTATLTTTVEISQTGVVTGVAGVAATPEAAAVPATLPRTGESGNAGWLLAAVALALSMALAFAARAKLR